MQTFLDLSTHTAPLRPPVPVFVPMAPLKVKPILVKKAVKKLAQKRVTFAKVEKNAGSSKGMGGSSKRKPSKKKYMSLSSKLKALYASEFAK